MSSESNETRSVLLNQIVADHLEAVESINAPDREEFIRWHNASKPTTQVGDIRVTT